MSFFARWLAIAVIGTTTLAHAQGGQGEGRRRSGPQNPSCGGELVVVLPNGERQQHASVQKFIEAFPTITIDQGEHPRAAVRLDAVLKAHGADWAEALNCENRSLHLPSGLPVEGNDLLVVTGKGALKAVREVRPGSYRNTLDRIRKLTFHVVSAPGQKQPPDAKK